MKGTINGHTSRSTVAPWRGEFMLPVSAEIRSAAGVAAGDEVDIDIDTEPRELSVPTDLTDALGSDADSKQFVAGRSYSNNAA